MLLLLFACSGDDETPTEPPDPTPAISIADQTAIESNTLVFTVSLDRATAHAVVFSYATTDVTAIAPGDYYGVSGVDTIVAGDTSATILVSSREDTESESSETFSVSLTSTTGANMARSLALGTITDNDPVGVSFASRVQPLLRTSCGTIGLNCHGSQFPGGGFNLGTDAAYDIVIAATGQIFSGGGPVVVSGNSAASTLYTQTTDQAISRMPKGLPALSPELQNLIRDWIDEGARDN